MGGLEDAEGTRRKRSRRLMVRFGTVRGVGVLDEEEEEEQEDRRRRTGGLEGWRRKRMNRSMGEEEGEKWDG